MRAGAVRQGAEEASRAGSGRFLVYPFAVALWAYLLRGFVETPTLIAFSVLGPLLALGGLAVLVSVVRHAGAIFESFWYLGVLALGLVLGLLLTAGAALTLAPQAPDRWLVTTATGWNFIERRLERFRDALERGDIALAQRLAERGLGDAAPLGAEGRPLIFDIREPERLAVLLESGLDPDARDADGRTLLATSHEPEIARALLAAGADPNARDRDGSTPLMVNRSYEESYLRLLLEAGADVHAENDLGEAVADQYPMVRPLLEEYAGDRPLRAGREIPPLDRGRRDWLVVDRDPAAEIGPSAVTLAPSPVRRGDLAKLDIRIGNGSDADRLLEVEAYINTAALLIGASHGGAVADPRQVDPSQTVRWPLLALPAHSQGSLTLDVVVRNDAVGSDVEHVSNLGDLSVHLRAYDRLGREEEVLQVYESPRGASEPLSPFSVRGFVPVAVPLVLMVAVWVMMRRRGRGRPTARERLRTATMIGKMGAGLAAVLCATVAIVRIVDGVEPYVRFDETTCTVLDRRALPRAFGTTSHSQLERRHEASRYRDNRPLYYNEPLTAVRVDTAEGPVFATGFTLGMAARTSMSFPELRAFPLGATVPCWVDPEAPTRFTLTRRATAGWIVSEVILIGLALVLGTIALRLGRRRPVVGDGQVPAVGRSPR